MLIGVTGGTGFIGRQLVGELVAAGHRVRVLIRNSPAGSSAKLPEGVQAVSGNLFGIPGLVDFCKGCDAIIHLAALAHVTNTRAEDHLENTLAGTENLLKAMDAAGADRLVFISSIKASAGSSASAYARAKAAAEVLIQEAGKGGLQSIILRPAIVYGPGMKGNLAAWIRRIRRGRAPRLPEVATHLQMISRQDVCRAILLALGQVSTRASVHVLHDNRAYGINALENTLRKASQVKLPAVALPRICWWLVAKAGDLLFSLTGKSLGFSSHSYRTLFCQDEMFPNTLPGFEPLQSFEDSLPHILQAADSD